MQAIMETIFHVFYLSTVTTLGIFMILKSNGNRYFKNFGIMAVLLGFGDAFHLIPRIIALLTTGLEAHAPALGFGKFVTSITMTFFYLILYSLYKRNYDVKNTLLIDIIMWLLATVRVALCFFPQNQWFVNDSSVLWGIYRNIPFAIIGIIMIYLYLKKGIQLKDSSGVKMAIAITLSFGFYFPVVLWASVYFLVGMLMIPKTIAYLWIVFMGFKKLKEVKIN